MGGRSMGIGVRFRGSVLGLVALGVLAAACTRSSAPAEAPPDTARVATTPGAAPVPQPAAAASQAAITAPPPAVEEPAFEASPDAPAEKKKEQARSTSVAPSKGMPAAAGLGLSGTGAGGGGRGFAGGRLGGAHRALKSAAPLQGGVVLAPAPSAPPLLRDAPMNTEDYAHVAESPFLAVQSQPLSTFSIDVDTASYASSRRYLTRSELPPKDAIRVEEWLNYFSYDYPKPSGNVPFAVSTEVSACPWNAAHKLVRIGIKGRELSQDNVPPRNLVFLLDVSGSMLSEDKLPLVKRGLSMLAENLRPQDTIAIVVYAGNSGLVLPPTSGRERSKIASALEGLEAGGSTNGGAGIKLAYSVAERQFKKGGINRVILATDGDFNVGTTSQGELVRLIEDERKTGVFLTVLGFGTGNTKDATMEMLADKGNGNYAYIDSLSEARKVLVREAGSTLVTIAKDVKLQVEMNPLRVESYKLIGYENRLLAKEDFNDDKKDAGEIGAGHDVTALYEVVPKGVAAPPTPAVDPLKYQAPGQVSSAAAASELMTVSIRYKPPQGDTSTKLSFVVADAEEPLAQASEDYRFAAAVANVALVLRGSPAVKQSSLDAARALAAGALGADVHGDRREFLALIDAARRARGDQTGLKTVAR